MAVTSVGKNRTYASIEDLPENQKLNDGDRILIQTDDGTALVDFSNVKIDLAHTTFETQITNLVDFTSTATAFIEQIESDFASIQEEAVNLKNSITEMQEKIDALILLVKFIMGSADGNHTDYIDNIVQGTLSGAGLTLYEECIEAVTAAEFDFATYNLLS